jgi:hypothetical protein
MIQRAFAFVCICFLVAACASQSNSKGDDTGQDQVDDTATGTGMTGTDGGTPDGSDDGTPDGSDDGTPDGSDDGTDSTDGSDVIVIPEDTKKPPEDAGPPPDPNICTGNVDGELQPYGGACCYTLPGHGQNPDCVWYSPTYGSGACIHIQCETSLCSTSPATYCSKTCVVGVDKVNNHTGEVGGDGITDDSGVNDCGGAQDGPVGSEFHCINRNGATQSPQGVCYPGTTFKQCEATSDCENGEKCGLFYIHDTYQTRCKSAAKGSVSVSEACNDDPAKGPIAKCGDFRCISSWGCQAFCKGNSDCATDTCVDGTCSKNAEATCEQDSDCSAWECDPDYKVYTNSPYMDQVCKPSVCNAVGQCNDPDFFCRPFWNGAELAEDVALSPGCRRKEPGQANYGEPCGVSGDGTGLPECVWSSGCVDNFCSGPCQNDANCGEGEECLQTYEWNIDVNDDDEGDTYVNVDLCRQWPHDGELTDCTSDAECGEGHHCQFRVKGEGEGKERVWEVEYKCRKDFDNQVSMGEVCGGTTKKQCDSDLCLVPGGGSSSKAMCTEYCGAAADCPEYIEFNGLTTKSICLSFRVNRHENLDGADDLYTPYCWRVTSNSSLKSCEETRSCTDAKEYCRALAIAGNPDEPVKVEHLCIYIGDSGGGVLSKLPTKQIGEVCSTSADCLGRSCMPDGQGGGYCTHLCAGDSDCSNPFMDNLACTEIELIPRPDKVNSGMSNRCVIKETCSPCENDGQCGGDFQCINFGGQNFLAKYNCGQPCVEDNDCLEAGTFCKQDFDKNGKPSGKKACVPTGSCP